MVTTRTRLALAAATTLATLSVVTSTTAAPTAAAAAPSPPRALNWVAMGDSYSAGAFVRPWATEDGCGRSAQSYPQQAARQLRVRLTDVTCSAADVRGGLLEQQTDMTGPPSVPPPGGWPAKPAQIAALSAGTDLVTIGIGGNSIGFKEIVEQCVAQGVAAFGMGKPCTSYYTTGKGASALNDRFASLEADLGTLMQAVRARAPQARVALVGYPALVDDSAGCRWGSWQQFGTAAKGDLPWLDSMERRVNTVLREQAGKAGAAYVDTYASSAGHGVCASGEERWMYGIKDELTGPGDQSDEPSILCRAIPSPGEACTLLHPNLRGTTHQAELVTRALVGLGASRA
ncbi:SGNH/GDSL hydrolase family protein [Streptomyces sp. NPDC006326]|uniref:SGNH/GDSL hydrolase family protein n=1 Tax=Streptomyces sp. NPDC006326 TaxID=3156752 RepID=UPI0033A7BF6C